MKSKITFTSFDIHFLSEMTILYQLAWQHRMHSIVLVTSWITSNLSLLSPTTIMFVSWTVKGIHFIVTEHHRSHFWQ